MNHYSQNDEQEFVLNFFGNRTGRLLDIGAYDGKTLSNSRALLENGWRGVLIEPDPRNFVKLMDNSVGMDVDLVLAAVGGNEDFMSMLTMDETEGRGWATTVVDECDGVKQPSKLRVCVQMLWPSALWDAFCAPKNFGEGFAFISLDAEWMDFTILKAFPKKMLTDCELLCIEPRNLTEREEMRRWLLGAGFRTAHETPENLLVCKA